MGAPEWVSQTKGSFGEDWRKDCRNAKGNFHFERIVRYRRSNDEDQKALEQ
jgi:hypothetical protein